MTALDLARALRITPSTRRLTVAFVGAGGKTTALFHLARRLAKHGPVWVTATSHLGVWQIPLADRHFEVVEDSAETQRHLETALLDHRFEVTLITGSRVGDRMQAIPETVLFWLHEMAGARSLPLLIEADGSRRKPLKAPADHEPPLPPFVNLVVVVAGLSALGAPLTEEHVFRPERFSALSGLSLNAPISPEALTRLLLHPQGGLKNIPATARRATLLNQADTQARQAAALHMSAALLPTYHAVLVTSLEHDQIHAVHQQIAAILLAAGPSQRFGRPKQLLEWRGKPFVRQVAETALQAGLRPVIVVTGAEAEAIQTALHGLEVQIAYNPDWPAGQGTSVACGVQALPQEVGGALFLLADQPQVSVEVIRALVETHAQRLSPILAPLVLEERRANPVLFDRLTFDDLQRLQGQAGGRALFDQYGVEYLPWHDPLLLLDVDTPHDYERLKREAE